MAPIFDLFSIRKRKHVTTAVPLTAVEHVGSPVLPVVGQHAGASFVTLAPLKMISLCEFPVILSNKYESLQSISGVSGDSSERLSAFGRVQSPPAGDALVARNKVSPAVFRRVIDVLFAGPNPWRSTGHQDHTGQEQGKYFVGFHFDSELPEQSLAIFYIWPHGV